MLGPCCCVWAFSSCGKRGPLFITVRRPLTVVASLVAEHRLQMHRLSSCGSRAQPLRGMWDLPRPGLEPVSPALAGGLPTTAPPGKPRQNLFLIWFVAFIFSIWIINSLHIYRSHLFHQKLLQLDWEVLIHPPYLPDIAPLDFYLFRSLQNSLNGKNFNSLGDCKRHLEQFFAQKDKKFWGDGIMKLPEKWQNVVEQKGEYVVQ